MSQVAVTPGARTALRGRLGSQAQPAAARLDTRRALQLGLAAVWLLDGVLQYQPVMYTKAFAATLTVNAPGNPSVIARPIIWDGTLIAHHLVLFNTVFATIQLLLGLGIAFRPTVRLALAGSVAWSLSVWWLGEGLGGVLNGTADPLTGAPGAVILYALLAVLLWPADRQVGQHARPAPFIAARAVGVPVARALWLVLWLSFSYFALLPAHRAPQALSSTFAGLESGEPGWLAAIERDAAALVVGQGPAASIVLAVVFAVIAVSVCLPGRAVAAARAALLLAIAVVAVIWVVGEALGGILMSGATDPNTGPLLGLLVLAYWPVRMVWTWPGAAPAVASAAEAWGPAR
jgi:hypothetical protein